MPFLIKHQASHITSQRGDPKGLILVVEKNQCFPLSKFLLFNGFKLLMCCKRKIFHSALVGSRSLTINLVNNADDIFKESKILTPSKALGRIRICQETLALAL